MDKRDIKNLINLRDEYSKEIISSTRRLKHADLKALKEMLTQKIEWLEKRYSEIEEQLQKEGSHDN